jgi:hypothetical protein
MGAEEEEQEDTPRYRERAQQPFDSDSVLQAQFWFSKEARVATEYVSLSHRRCDFIGLVDIVLRR